VKLPGTAALTALLSILLLGGCASKQAPAPMGPPPVPASIGQAETQAVQITLQAIGNVEPLANVQVRAQVAGELMRAAFHEGDDVKKGQLLFEIDPRPYDDALRQAEASVARDRAMLAQAEANLAREEAQLRNAKTDAQRNEQLVKEGIISRSVYDTVRTTADVSSHAVRADQAAIASARASLEADQAAAARAKLDRAYCEITAPIAGRTGNLLVHAGNYVKAAGDTALVAINQVEPVFVSFSVPEQHLAAIRRLNAAHGMKVLVSAKDAPEAKLPGTLSVIDNTVDTTTGMIRLKATLPNAGRALWPGQFVNVTLTLDTIANAVVVPSEAVQSGQKGSFVYVMKPDQTVEMRMVKTGQIVGAKIVIESGVKAGETVVTDGQMLLAPGARLLVLPAVKSEGAKQ
jgi:multidrug efflux system membrane fusion protein